MARGLKMPGRLWVLSGARGGRFRGHDGRRASANLELAQTRGMRLSNPACMYGPVVFEICSENEVCVKTPK